MVKKILMVIAPKDFRDEEYFEPRRVFENKGFEVITTTENHGECIGMLGAHVRAEKNLADIEASDFEAIVFVGGGGSEIFFQNKSASRLVKDFFGQGKVVGAICIAPMILANAGILAGKKVTISSAMAKEISKFAKYTGKDVEIDGKIVTASGPDASTKFAEAIVSLL